MVRNYPWLWSSHNASQLIQSQLIHLYEQVYFLIIQESHINWEMSQKIYIKDCKGQTDTVWQIRADQTQRHHVQTMTVSPDCVPSMKSSQVPADHKEWWKHTRYRAFFLPLLRFIHPSVHDSSLFITLSSCSSVSWDILSVSCLSASRSMYIMSYWHCITWLQTPGTVKLQRHCL